MELEVCAYSLESCLAARMAGATRVELCAAPFEGGTTPSVAAIIGAMDILKGENVYPPLQLYVMIRPRGGDFYYSSTEFEQMEQEIEFIKGIVGINGVVLGLLNKNGAIDVERTSKLVERAKNGIYINSVTGEKRACAPLGVTFHRAFDMSRGGGESFPFKVLEDVILTGANRVLTSGFYPTAIEGKKAIGELVKQAAGRINIMAGSGVCAANAIELAQLGVDALHMSGKAERESEMTYRNPLLSMGAKIGAEYSVIYTDKKAVEAVKKLIF
ncbi:MAG: copper homeostasis protein CutC [Bacteroidales bacterium]